MEGGRRRLSDIPMAVGTPSPPGYRGHPTRPYLMRVERGNPVRVRRRCLGGAGQPTVRGAQSPGGSRTPKKRMPVAERQRESGSVGPVLQPEAVV